MTGDRAEEAECPQYTLDIGWRDEPCVIDGESGAMRWWPVVVARVHLKVGRRRRTIEIELFRPGWDWLPTDTLRAERECRDWMERHESTPVLRERARSEVGTTVRQRRAEMEAEPARGKGQRTQGRGQQKRV